MKNLFRENWIVIIIAIAFITSSLLALRNHRTISENQVAIRQSALVKENTQAILTRVMHGLDLGVRGFALTNDEKLLMPYHEAVETMPLIFKQIDSLLTRQNYPQKHEGQEVIKEITSYVKWSNEMIQQVRDGNHDAVVEMLKQDKGYEVWTKYSHFNEPLVKFENEIAESSLSAYNSANRSNLFLQLGILVLGLPMLYFFVARVNRERRRRREVLAEVDHADKTYVFNDGNAGNGITEEVNARSLHHVKLASDFVAALAKDNYDVQWDDFEERHRAINEKTLAGNLFRLRERLKTVKEEDEKRNWMNAGMAEFAEVLRSNQQNQSDLLDHSVSYLTQYLNAQQGSLYVAEKDDQGTFLNLGACFAFNRKKWIEKRIECGQGLVGQAFLEGEVVLLTNVPQGYTTITSGLGDATPTCLVIVPMKTDSEIAGVAEFAAFHLFEPHQITFLQKAGELLASTLIHVRNTQTMKSLLDEAATREAMMREREEELRQNMEELQATQEQLTRQYKERERATDN